MMQAPMPDVWNGLESRECGLSDSRCFLRCGEDAGLPPRPMAAMESALSRGGSVPAILATAAPSPATAGMRVAPTATAILRVEASPARSPPGLSLEAGGSAASKLPLRPAVRVEASPARAPPGLSLEAGGSKGSKLPSRPAERVESSPSPAPSGFEAGGSKSSKLPAHPEASPSPAASGPAAGGAQTASQTSRQSRRSTVSRGSKKKKDAPGQSKARGVGGSLFPTRENILDAVQSLCKDELRPYGRILRKRLGEFAQSNGKEATSICDVERLRELCMFYSDFEVEPLGEADWFVVAKGTSSTFVDIYDEEDPYPEELWEAASDYFGGLSEHEMNLPGGRYERAQGLRSLQLPFLSGYSLGQVNHIVQIAMTKRKLLGYLNGAIVPYSRSETAVRERCAEQHVLRRKSKLPIATWETLRRYIKELLREDPKGGVPLSNIKRVFKSRFGCELSQTALGHASVSALFEDPRLQDVCRVTLRDGYYVHPAEALEALYREQVVAQYGGEPLEAQKAAAAVLPTARPAATQENDARRPGAATKDDRLPPRPPVGSPEAQAFEETVLRARAAEALRYEKAKARQEARQEAALAEARARMQAAVEAARAPLATAAPPPARAVPLARPADAWEPEGTLVGECAIPGESYDWSRSNLDWWQRPEFGESDWSAGVAADFAQLTGEQAFAPAAGAWPLEAEWAMAAATMGAQAWGDSATAACAWKQAECDDTVGPLAMSVFENAIGLDDGEGD
eukprot:TRINITY_DN26925_c0_g1_i2.p1 TRINITY_DN26925_c0_g1~~TRINITY_DN26925_c0_g1_i2.p1  ORF type:complete len:742 (-),score=181.92 TRINITY_DN26925_c0_g1_i2:207-2432(-)